MRSGRMNNKVCWNRLLSRWLGGSVFTPRRELVCECACLYVCELVFGGGRGWGGWWGWEELRVLARDEPVYTFTVKDKDACLTSPLQWRRRPSEEAARGPRGANCLTGDMEVGVMHWGEGACEGDKGVRGSGLQDDEVTVSTATDVFLVDWIMIPERCIMKFDQW